MTNFKKLFKEALTPDYLKEDRKAKEYIQSIEDPEERESERKRMFGDDELDEDINDPALVRARAAQMADEKEKAKQVALDKKYGSSFMDKLDAELDLKAELEDLNHEREMIMIDMEEEAEPEGGEIADRYGERLNQIDQRIADIQEELDDLRMYESVKENEDEEDDMHDDPGDIRIDHDYYTENLNEDDDEYVSIFHYYDKLNKDIKADKKFSDMNEGRSMARFSYADKGSPIKVGDTLYKDGKAGKVIQKLEDRDKLNVEFDDGSIIGVNYTSVEGDKIVREISTTPVSGTKAGVIYSLDNRKYVLTSDVKGARIGDYTNITLPKGTVIYNLPGGLMADHESLRQYAKLSGNIYFDKPTYAGVGIRQMPDILTAIENNSNVIEESLNEMEDGIPAFMMRDGMYREVVDDSVNYDDFEKRIYGFVGPKFYKSIHSEHPGALKNFYDKFRVTNPNLEEDAELNINKDDANDIGDEIISKMDYAESKTFDFKKMIKEALTPGYLK